MPPLEGRLVGDAARLGRALEGDVLRMCLMKETQVASGFRQCSRTAPAKEVNLLLHRCRRHLGTPAAMEPPLQTGRRIARSRSSQGLSRCLTGVHHGDAGEASNLDHAGLALSSSALFKLINTGCFTPLCNKF